MSDSEKAPPTKRARLEEPDFTADPCPSADQFSLDDKYNNFVTPEEVQKLKEFKILDEVKSDDEDSASDAGDSDAFQEIPEEEIEKMLEENLPEGFKGVPKPKEKPYMLRSKVVMEEKGVNPFEVLPLEWICVRHVSGVPVYLHRPSRVVTLAKPYSLGTSNVQRHDIPISAIPCLAYRRALHEEEKQKEVDAQIQRQVDLANAILVDTPTPKVADQIVDKLNKQVGGVLKSEQQVARAGCPLAAGLKEESGMEAHALTTALISEPIADLAMPNGAHNKEGGRSSEAKLEPDQGATENAAAKGDSEKDEKSDAVKIQAVIEPGGRAVPPPRVENVSTSWKTQHLTATQLHDYCQRLFQFKTVEVMHFKCWADRRKYTKARKALQYPALPEGTKLITIPGSGADDGKGKRDWVMNMNGRCYLSVFHEYVNRALHKQPVYEFTQLENAATPYQATVYIGEMQYGVGFGSSKRQAKAAAARASIRILIPEMNEDLAAPNSNEPDFSFFDYVGIEDPRIAEFCAATCEPSPHAILRTCLLRNFGANDRHIAVAVDKLEYQKIQLRMSVGKHSATVVCKNKKAAKQRASQAILQSLHPQLRSWGSLLRLYGSRSVPSAAQRKRDEQQVTLLQEQARRHQPNHAVLTKLRLEMLKMRARDQAVAPIGTLMLPALPNHSASNLNNLQL